MQRTTEEFVESIEHLTQEIQELYLADRIPWIVGVSWGKDSSTVLQLIWTAIAGLSADRLHKKIHVITTDTQVENPIVSAWVRQCVKNINAKSLGSNLPFQAHLLVPEVTDTFWTCLIGKGYAAPNRLFRWCTSRLKINPSVKFTREVVQQLGEVILVLGTRKAESQNRRRTMERHERGRVRDRLSPNSSLPNSLIYSPIEDWRTDEVWMYLMQFPNPWGGNNQELFQLYRGATSDNECPLVVDTSTPSCGDSRFGCWTCTLVNKDKSMEAMIQNDEDKEWLQPLLDIRDELAIEDDRDKRDFRRMSGRVDLYERKNAGGTEVVPIPGPYTKYWREYWLRKVLTAQVLVRQTAPEQMRDIVLISNEELSEIRHIWREQKHEFDDRLPAIYREVTGELFQDWRVVDSLLGQEEWSVLAEICGEDPMHLELMVKLLDTERQHRARSRRGIFDNLTKCFNSSSMSEADAIENAHQIRELKNATKAGDFKKIEQLSWSQLKFHRLSTDETD